MSLSKAVARKIVFPSLFLGGYHKYLLRQLKPGIINIMYHGVTPQNTSYFSPRHMEIKQFDAHLNFLSKHFKIIPLKEAFELYRSGKAIKEKYITITFDDGFKNNLDYAAPILEKYKVHSTIFASSLCTVENNQKILWSDFIAALLYFNKNNTITIGENLFKNGVEINSKLSIWNFIKQLGAEERDKVLDELDNRYQVYKKLENEPDYLIKLMSPDELKKIDNSDFIDIQSHGHLHYNLGLINKTKAIEDIKHSKELLESCLNKKIDVFAYPDGSYSTEILDACEELGFNYQMAVNYQLDSDKKDHRILDRLAISNTTTFESNILRLLNYYKLKNNG